MIGSSKFEQDQRGSREPPSGKKPPQKDKKDEFNWKKSIRPLFFWMVIVLILIVFIKFYYAGQTEIALITYSEIVG